MMALNLHAEFSIVFESPLAKLHVHLMLYHYLLIAMLGIMTKFLITILVVILIVAITIMQCALNILVMYVMSLARFVVMHGHVLNRLLVIGFAGFHCGLAVFDCVLVQYRIILYVLTAIMIVPTLMKAVMDKNAWNQKFIVLTMLDLQAMTSQRTMSLRISTRLCICSPLIYLASVAQALTGVMGSSFKPLQDGPRRGEILWTITCGQSCCRRWRTLWCPP